MSNTWREPLQGLYSLVLQELTLKSVCFYGFTLLLSWLFSKMFIFPKLSPLNKIPGIPVSWKQLAFGHLPEIIRKEAIDPYIGWVKEMKTGIIRYRHILGNQRVMIADADAVKDVLVTHALHYPRPVFLFGFFNQVVGGTSLLTLEGHEHAVQRRLCSSAFTLSSVQALLPTFQKHVERLCDMWTTEIRSSTEGPTKLNIQTCLSKMTFDIISEAAFGYKSDSLTNPLEKSSAAFNFLLTPSGSSVERLFRMLLPNIYNKLPSEFNRKFQQSLDFLHSLIVTVIEEKREKMAADRTGKGSSMDLLEKLLLAKDVETGAGLSKTQIRDHVMTFMLAGHETTAANLMWILLSLAKDPYIQTKARQEVMSHLPDLGQPITYEDIEQMPYINCVVKEGLRLYPPAPVVLRQATKHMTLCDRFDIPKDTIINISIGALHRNPAYWGEDAEEFRPERFLDEERIPQQAYQPFISGPHMCIGYKFSLLEARLALALMLRHFEFSPLPDVTYRKRQMVTMRPDPPLCLNVSCI